MDIFKTKEAASDKEYEDRLVKALDRREANEATPEDDRCINNALKTSLTKCQNRRKKEAAKRKQNTEGEGSAPNKKKRKMTQRRKRQAKNAACNSESEGSGSDGDSSSDDEDGSKGKDLIGSCFED